MDNPRDTDPHGPFEARYLAFLETITQLRPRLHRYCSRMTGSVMDGEDVVQDALFEAYRKLDQYDDSRPLAPWLFRIAHNRCIDFLRRRGVRVEAETAAMGPDSVMPVDSSVLGVGRAVEQLVISLPPMERACVLLKDIFDYTLEEIAELVSSTVGSVKAALNRGRLKLAASSKPATSRREVSPELSRLLHLYVDRFNKRDWEGLRNQNASMVLQGSMKEALPLLHKGLDVYRATGSELNVPYYLSMLGDAYTQVGQLEDAHRTIGEALALVDKNEE